MDDDDWDQLIYLSTPRQARRSWFEQMMGKKQPKWIGIDWGKESGMNRGDVIKRDGNITHVRFNTVLP